jgi:hypothetical protein
MDDHFGLCPHCKKTDGYANAGKSHRFYCKEHKVSWCVGSNLFSDWRGQTEDEQRRIWNEIGLNDFANIEPYFPPEVLATARAPIPTQDWGLPF